MVAIVIFIVVGILVFVGLDESFHPHDSMAASEFYQRFRMFRHEHRKQAYSAMSADEGSLLGSFDLTGFHALSFPIIKEFLDGWRYVIAVVAIACIEKITSSRKCHRLEERIRHFCFIQMMVFV